MIRDQAHWLSEDHKQRITKKQLQEMLFKEEDIIIFHGRIRRLKAESLGVGVYEISKESLRDET